MSNPDVDTLGPESMTGIGAVSAGWLKQAGIRKASQVRELGAVACYLKVIEHSDASANLNLLWALQGAIEGLHWTMISPAQRDKLKAELASAQDQTK